MEEKSGDTTGGHVHQSEENTTGPVSNYWDGTNSSSLPVVHLKESVTEAPTYENTSVNKEIRNNRFTSFAEFRFGGSSPDSDFDSSHFKEFSGSANAVNGFAASFSFGEHSNDTRHQSASCSNAREREEWEAERTFMESEKNQEHWNQQEMLTSWPNEDDAAVEKRRSEDGTEKMRSTPNSSIASFSAADQVSSLVDDLDVAGNIHTTPTVLHLDLTSPDEEAAENQSDAVRSDEVQPCSVPSNGVLTRNGVAVTFSEATKPMKRSDAIRMLENKTLVNDVIPEKLVVNRCGSQTFLINKKCFPDPKAMQTDGFKSWCQTKDNVKKAPKWDNDPKGSAVRMKRSRATHPDNSLLRRNIYFLVDDLGNIKSDVLYQYVLLGNDIELPYRDTTDVRRATPSDVAIIKESLQNRTTAQAKEFLRAKGKEVDSKQVSNIATKTKECPKQGPGPRLVTDLGKITVMADRNPAITVTHGGEKFGSTAGTTICILFPDAIALYGKSCPKKGALLKFKESMKILDTMTREEAVAFTKELLKRRTASQTFPGFGSGMQPDTTFDLSHLLVTVVVGTLDNIVTVTSGRNHPVVLCAMLHDSKDQYHHDVLGRKLSTAFQKLAPGHCVPSFTSDAETALQLIGQGAAFEHTTRLSCDLHCKKNLLDRFGKGAGEMLSFELFGRTQNINDERTYLRGLAGAFTKEEYVNSLNSLKERHPRLYAWVTSRKVDFFTGHSLRSKLEGAFLGQWNTSNIVENQNSQFKIDIKSFLPGEDLLDYLQKKHNEKMKEVFAAIVGGSKHLRLADHVKDMYRSSAEWEVLTNEQKRSHLATFGLRFVNKDYKTLMDKLPNWITTGKKDSVNDGLCSRILALEVDAARDFFYVKSKNHDEKVSVVRKEGSVYSCSRNECKGSPHLVPCEHIIIVILSLGDEEKNRDFDGLYSRYKMTTAKQAVATHVHPTDGGKFQARIGQLPSKDSRKRSMETISSLTYHESQQLAGTAGGPTKKKKSAASPSVDASASLSYHEWQQLAGTAGGPTKKKKKTASPSGDANASQLDSDERMPSVLDEQRNSSAQQTDDCNRRQGNEQPDVPMIRSNRDRPISQRNLYTPG